MNKEVWSEVKVDVCIIMVESGVRVHVYICGRVDLRSGYHMLIINKEVWSEVRMYVFVFPGRHLQRRFLRSSWTSLRRVL